MNGRTKLMLFTLAATAVTGLCACDNEVVVVQNDPSCQKDEDCPDGICLRGECVDGECTKDADCGPLPPACGDSDTMLLRPIGECDDSYHCSYTPVEEDCPEWGCNFDTGQCYGPPCEGVVCQTPRNECFMANGSCNGGNCEYPLRNGVTCDDGDPCTTGDTCEEGVCAGTPVACDTPPTDYCFDAEHLFQYRAQGICNELGGCDFQSDIVTCMFGCDSTGSVAVCRADPCGSVSCDQPPADFCIDAEHVRLFRDQGTCNASNLCDYQTNDAFCPFGCYQGACKPDPCEGVICDSPPPPTCVNNYTRKSFTPTATCVNGNCPYLSSEQSCQYGCLNGLCRNNPCLGTDCDDGNPCTDDSCNPADGQCHHSAANNGMACQAPSAACPQGTCSGGACLSNANVTCTASVDVDLCMDMDVPGYCTGSGQCVPQQPQSYQCTIPCNGICIECFFLQFCIEF